MVVIIFLFLFLFFFFFFNNFNIFNNDRECVRNQDLLVSSQAIKSVGLIGLRHHFAVEAVTQILLDLLKSENDVIMDNALQSLQGFVTFMFYSFFVLK